MNPRSKGWLKEYLDFRLELLKELTSEGRKSSTHPDHSLYRVIQPTGIMYGQPVNVFDHPNSNEWDEKDRILTAVLGLPKNLDRSTERDLANLRAKILKCAPANRMERQIGPGTDSDPIRRGNQSIQLNVACIIHLFQFFTSRVLARLRVFRRWQIWLAMRNF